VVTDARLIAVSETRIESERHGTTARFAATTDWAGDFKLTFATDTGTIELKDIDEDDARRLYARLRVASRVPVVTADSKRRSKLEAPEPKDRFGAGLVGEGVLPDPTRGLDLMRRRWLLKSVDETGPRRRSLAYVAHSLFYGTAIVVSVAVGIFV